MTSIILFVVYYTLGMVLAFIASACLAMIACALVALTRIFAYKWTWLQLLGYLMALGVGMFLIQLGLLGAGTLGDHTHYRMQIGIVVGAVWPGLLSLRMVPLFARIAARTGKGDFTDN